jgi:hypothetical protein
MKVIAAAATATNAQEVIQTSAQAATAVLHTVVMAIRILVMATVIRVMDTVQFVLTTLMCAQDSHRTVALLMSIIGTQNTVLVNVTNVRAIPVVITAVDHIHVQVTEQSAQIHQGMKQNVLEVIQLSALEVIQTSAQAATAVLHTVVMAIRILVMVTVIPVMGTVTGVTVIRRVLLLLRPVRRTVLTRIGVATTATATTM